MMVPSHSFHSTASTLAVVVLLCATMGVKSNDDAAAKSGKSGGGYKLFHDDCDGYDPRRDGYTDYGYGEEGYPGTRHRRVTARRGRRGRDEGVDSTEVRRREEEGTKAGKAGTTTTTTSAKCSKVQRSGPINGRYILPLCLSS